MIQNHVTKSNSSTFHETCTWLALSWVLAWFDTGRSYQFHYVSMLLRLHICDWKWERHQRKREKCPAHHINTQPNTNCAHNLLYGIFCHLCNKWQYNMPWFLCTLPHTFHSAFKVNLNYGSFKYHRKAPFNADDLPTYYGVLRVYLRSDIIILQQFYGRL